MFCLTRKMKLIILLLFVLVVSCMSGKLDLNVDRNSRIVGGWNASPNQFPHQISLRIRGRHTCGGSIISPTWIVTAAHCAAGQTSDYSIVAGSNQLSRGGVTIPVAQKIVHENYGNFKNDIALLRLQSSLKYSNAIKSITLATREIPANAQVIISGWGGIHNGGPIPENLKYNFVKYTTGGCGGMTGDNAKGLLCLAHPVNNGACHGDSGGPAIFNGELVGVANFVVGGCGSPHPDGYAKVSYHRDWIKRKSGV